MAGNLHRHFFADSGSGQVSSRCSSKIVNQGSPEFAFFTGCFPCLLKVADLLALVVKNIRTIKPAFLVPFLK
jgi:hypothetical protein